LRTIPCDITFFKALLHATIFPATYNATDDDSMAKQVAEYMLHAAIYLTRFRKRKATFPETRSGNFSLRDMLRRGVLHAQSRPQLVLQCNEVAEKQLLRLTAPYERTKGMHKQLARNRTPLR